MKNPNNDDLTRQLLDSAKKAAEDLRREEGFWRGVLRLLERRSDQRHELRKMTLEQAREDAIVARCQAGKHDIQDWKHVQDTDVYGETSYSSSTKLPIKRTRTWVGHCTHCGAPGTITRDL